MPSHQGRLLYLDCFSGIAGDMLIGALLELGVDFAWFQQRLSTLPLGEVQLTAQRVKKKGFAATKFDVSFPPQHAHRHLSDIEKMLDGGQLDPAVVDLAKRIFRRLGQAEASVHGSTLEKVHFHEVGAIDSIIDIAGIALCLEHLKIEQIFCSPVTLGFGTIEIAHGKVSVPAPATALLLAGMPVVAGEQMGELSTPTGAAVLAEFANPTVGLPWMEIQGVGMGAGTKDLPHQPNVVRAYLGLGRIDPAKKMLPTPAAIHEQSHDHDDSVHPIFLSDQVWQIDCHMDDITGQQMSYCQAQLWKLDINDCYLVPIQMKKNRAGQMLCILCTEAVRPAVEKVLLQHTPTIGLRKYRVERTLLVRRQMTVDSPWGPGEVKLVRRPKYGWQAIAEFDSCSAIAQTHDVPLQQIKQTLERMAQQQIENDSV